VTALGCVITGVGTVSAIAAGTLWLYASLLEVPDNVDTIVRELQRVSRWNSYAAIAACIAAFCAAYGFASSLSCLQ